MSVLCFLRFTCVHWCCGPVWPSELRLQPLTHSCTFFYSFLSCSALSSCVSSPLLGFLPLSLYVTQLAVAYLFPLLCSFLPFYILFPPSPCSCSSLPPHSSPIISFFSALFTLYLLTPHSYIYDAKFLLILLHITYNIIHLFRHSLSPPHILLLGRATPACFSLLFFASLTAPRHPFPSPLPYPSLTHFANLLFLLPPLLSPLFFIPSYPTPSIFLTLSFLHSTYPSIPFPPLWISVHSPPLLIIITVLFIPISTFLLPHGIIFFLRVSRDLRPVLHLRFTILALFSLPLLYRLQIVTFLIMFAYFRTSQLHPVYLCIYYALITAPIRYLIPSPTMHPFGDPLLRIPYILSFHPTLPHCLPGHMCTV